MMKIALQMKSPYLNEQDMVSSIDAQSYMYKFGFFGGVDAAWKDYVRQSYEDFDASFAANEGIEAVIRDLVPSRRRLTVKRVSRNRYSIECEQGAKAFLTATEDDSIILSFGSDCDNDDESLDLAYYESKVAARFIGNIFKAYRRIQKDFWHKLSHC